MDLERYHHIFVEEAHEHLAELSRALLALEKDPGDAEALAEGFRMAHSVKGMAASLSYGAVERLAHALEDCLQAARDLGRVDGKETLGRLFRGLEGLERMVAHVRDAGGPPEPDAALVAELGAPARRVPAVGEPAARRAPARLAGRQSAGAPAPPSSQAPAASVRVRTQTLDRFLSAVGEVILSSSQLRTAAESSVAAPTTELAEGFDHMVRTVGELQRRALDLRTTPLQRVVDPLPRLAREIAERAGKGVEVVIQGAELELDRSILDRLSDPLVHVIRNAVDHGIEMPPERRAAGKAEWGHIVIEGRREKEAIRIDVRDDGAGLDLVSLRARAVEIGLLHPELAGDLPPEEIAALVFHPGLSTAESVSEISGRGVGMDVVRSTIESLGGSVDITTRSGHGTTVSLRLPITAAVQRVLLVGLGAEIVAFPIARVERLLEVEKSAVERSGREAFLLLDDVPVPVIDLAEQLGLPSCPGGGMVPLILTEVRSERTALRVERVAGHQEIYVKPLPPLLTGVRAVGGLTILGDGRPIFVLDAHHLL